MLLESYGSPYLHLGILLGKKDQLSFTRNFECLIKCNPMDVITLKSMKRKKEKRKKSRFIVHMSHYVRL